MHVRHHDAPTYRDTIRMSTSKYDTHRVFATNLRTLLDAGDWTQIEAAEQLGISQGSLSDLMSGKRAPSTKGMESIAYRLRLPVTTFTSKPISLERMRRLLSGHRDLMVSEPRAAYRAAKPYDPWLRSLQQRWKRSPESRNEIRTAARVLFGKKAGAVVRWLEAQ